jgi:hypothetical protein
MKWLIIFAFFSLIFSGCSQKAENVDAKMSFGLGAISMGVMTTPTGMIWGKHTVKNISFGEKIVPGSVFERQLESGPWNFWVIVWPHDDLKGITKCDFKSMNLLPNSNQMVDIAFKLKNENCTQQFGEIIPLKDEFSNQTHLKVFPNIALNDCRVLNDPNNYDSDCNTEGLFSSYRIVIQSFDNDIVKDAIVSDCVSNFFGGGTNSNIPVGDANTPFKTKIRAYYDSSCFDGAGLENYYLPNGLAQPTAQVKILSKNESYCFGESTPSCNSYAEYCPGGDDINQNCELGVYPLSIYNSYSKKFKLIMSVP